MEIRTIAQQLLFSTVPIETKDVNDEPIGTGTSFVLSHDFPDHGSELFLVSNKHVIDKAWTGYTYYTTIKDGKPDIGNPFFIKTNMGYHFGWHGHPSPDVDIAVRPISWELDLIGKADTKAFYMNLSTDIIPPADYVENADAILPIVFVGYPNGMFDRKHYTPIIRRGTTATPIQLDFDGRPAFLIDASVFPGSSGSPVFSYDLANNGNIAGIKLLGILAEVFCRTEVGEVRSLPAPTSTSFVALQQMIDLGVVFKSYLILETINDFWSKNGEVIRRMKKEEVSNNGSDHTGDPHCASPDGQP
jgi:hypothetical protein